MASLQLVIGNKNYSSWSLRPWLFMREMGIDFKEIKISLVSDLNDPKLLAYGSNAKVPILVDGELTVWDSLAICEYVSEQYCEGAGWPKDLATRAKARCITAEMHSSFFNIRQEMSMNCRKNTAHIRLSEAVHQEIERVRTLWHNSLQQSQGDWLFGEFSIADAFFAPVVIRFCQFGIELDGVEKDYVAHVLKQPSLKQWIQDGKDEEIMHDYEL